MNYTYQLLDFQPSSDDFRMEVLDGLKCEQKHLDPKWLYDESGSMLFENITTLPEYYPTRTELSILKENASEIVSFIGGQTVLIDLGNGSSEKVKVLLDEMPHPAAYMPVDISREFLVESAESIVHKYPDLNVTAICADYTQAFDFPTLNSKKVIFFPGSTLGNFEIQKGKAFLKLMAGTLSKGDGFLIGIDLKKSPSILNRAYNDSTGVTAAFNLNVLKRINRELNGNFNLEHFTHLAFYNEKQGRIEMHLKSMIDQTVLIEKVPIYFQKGETIHTENSYKFDLDSFQSIAKASGLDQKKVWTDTNSLFAVIYLEKNDS